MAHTNSWTNLIPPDTENFRQGANQMRKTRQDVQERMLVDHEWPNSTAGGEHKKVTLKEQSSDPSPVTGAGIIYTKDDSGTTVPYFMDDAGAISEISLGSSGSTGGGAGIEVLELKSQMEKMGGVYPLSFESAINESYTDTQNAVLTVRASYASGTSLVADINSTALDELNATTGWSAGTNTPTLAAEGTIKIQGTNSLKMTKADLNGAIDAYKTFAFSFVNNRLRVSCYVDTVSNLTRLWIKLESSAGNDATYYLPVASLAATTWKHWTIDPDTTPDATTGTIVPGNITKVYFGATTSGAQTINVYWDYFVQIDERDLALPTQMQIFDGTNQELVYIASEGTGITGLGTYTITALGNAYTSSTSYAKQRNVTIAGNRGVFPSGLTGAAAETVYDIARLYLPKSATAKTLYISQRYWDEEFPISVVVDAKNTKLYGPSKAGYFGDGDKVIFYSKRYVDSKYQSFYNSTLASNFMIVTATDVSQVGDDILIQHTGESNTGVSVGEWYAVRYSAEMLYRVETAAQNQTLQELTPTTFIPKDDGIPFPAGIVAHWEMEPDGGGALVDKKNGKALAINGVTLQRGGHVSPYEVTNFGGNNLTRVDASLYPAGSYALYDYAIEVWMTFLSATGTGYRYIVCSEVAASNHLHLAFESSADYLKFGYTTAYAQIAPAAWAPYVDGNYHHVVGVQEGLSIKLYIDGVLVASGNLVGTENWTPTQLYIGGFSGQCISASHKLDEITIWRSSAGAGLMPTQAMILRRYAAGRGKRYGSDCGYIVRGSALDQSGTKLTVATKLSRQDATNCNPEILQRDALLV